MSLRLHPYDPVANLRARAAAAVESLSRGQVQGFELVVAPSDRGHKYKGDSHERLLAAQKAFRERAARRKRWPGR